MAGMRNWWPQPWMPMGREGKRQEPLKWARAELKMSWQKTKTLVTVQGVVVLWESGKGNLPLESLKGRMGWRTEQWARTKAQCCEKIWIGGAWQVFRLSEDKGAGGEAYKDCRGKVKQEVDGRNSGTSILCPEPWPGSLLLVLVAARHESLFRAWICILHHFKLPTWSSCARGCWWGWQDRRGGRTC